MDPPSCALPAGSARRTSPRISGSPPVRRPEAGEHPCRRIGARAAPTPGNRGRLPAASEEAPPAVTIVGVGAVIPIAVLPPTSSSRADTGGHGLPDLARSDLPGSPGEKRRGGDASILDAVFARERAAPIVAVLDGHPHTLAFLGGVHRQPLTDSRRRRVRPIGRRGRPVPTLRDRHGDDRRGRGRSVRGAASLNEPRHDAKPRRRDGRRDDRPLAQERRELCGRARSDRRDRDRQGHNRLRSAVRRLPRDRGGGREDGCRWSRDRAHRRRPVTDGRCDPGGEEPCGARGLRRAFGIRQAFARPRNEGQPGRPRQLAAKHDVRLELVGGSGPRGW